MRAFACAVLLVVACNKDEPPPPPPPPAPAPAPAPKKMLPAGDHGTCTLHATGAFTADETIPGSSSSAASKYWLTDDQRGTPMPAITVNCSGKDLRVSFVSNPNGSAPFGVKTYTVARNGDLVLLGRAGKSLADFAGTVDITAFDGAHIAGTLDLTAKQVGGGAVAIKGDFDFRK